MPASPLVRVPEPLKPYVMKLVQLYKLKLADDAIRAIDAAKTLDEALPSEKSAS